MVWFWAAAGAMAVVVAAAMVLALRRGQAAGEGAGAGDGGGADLGVYRAQLAEIERDVARGTLAADEAGRLRTEVARRLLAADARAGGAGAAGPAGGRGPLVAGVVLAVLVGAGAVGAYLRLGAPGYPDLPLADRLAEAAAAAAARPAQAAAEAAAPPVEPPEVPADFLDLMEALRARMAERPDDEQGLRLLAANEARLARFAAARAAQERLVAVLGPRAAAADHAFLGRLMIAAAGGIVTPEAEAALAAAVAADPGQADALFFLGVGQLQTGRPDRAFALWRQYLEVAPPDDPFRAEVEGGIAGLAQLAGVPFEPPAPAASSAPGPDAAAVEAAEGLTPAEREEMARGMVARLSARLAAEGGPAQDWARLIRALGVLGETAQARAIAEEARDRFAGRADDLALIAAAAADAGVGE